VPNPDAPQGSVPPKLKSGGRRRSDANSERGNEGRMRRPRRLRRLQRSRLQRHLSQTKNTSVLGDW